MTGVTGWCAMKTMKNPEFSVFVTSPYKDEIKKNSRNFLKISLLLFKRQYLCTVIIQSINKHYENTGNNQLGTKG